MKKLRVLQIILKRTKATQIISGFVLFLFITAVIIYLAEPGIDTYREALWYCYTIISTTGFGDIVAVTFIGRLCSVLISIYSIFVIAIVTGVVVNFYSQMVQMQHKETLTMFMDKLENLPELSKEDLASISQKIKKLR